MNKFLFALVSCESGNFYIINKIRRDIYTVEKEFQKTMWDTEETRYKQISGMLNTYNEAVQFIETLDTIVEIVEQE